MFSSFLAFSLLMSVTSTPGQTANESATATVAKPVKEKKICRQNDDSTSRVARRICRTAKEWEEGGASSGRAGVRSVTENN